MAGAEALICWNHPERGLLLPGDFLPAIAECDFSITLGNWVLMEALRQKADWLRQGLSILVSVNVAVNHIQHPEFTEKLVTLLQQGC